VTKKSRVVAVYFASLPNMLEPVAQFFADNGYDTRIEEIKCEGCVIELTPYKKAIVEVTYTY